MAVKIRWLGICILLTLLLSSFTVMLPEKAQTDDQAQWYSQYTQTIVDKDGQRLEVDSTPLKPPQVKMEAAELPEPDPGGAAGTLTGVPAFTWVYGCSPTSAGMMAGYYDQPARGYTNMYAGPTNGGVCPMNNEIYWGHTVYPGATCGECPLVATHQGYDGLAVKGHVDDFWYDYLSTTDPYWGAWTQHVYADCTADYMGTNQYYNWNNSDGSTTFYYNTSNAPLYDYTGSESGSPPRRDGCHGMKLFFQSRGYTVSSNYNQRIYGYGGISAGFTYNDFKTQIDAGRPVLIQLAGHTVLGYGYSDPDTIAIHDTWDNLDHTMTWGSTYAGLQHRGVTVIELAVPGYALNISSSSGGTVTTPGVGSFGPYTYGQIVNISATPNPCYYFVNWTGNITTIANTSAASTTITMNGSYSITANFATDPFSAFSGGDGTPANPYLIETVCALQNMSSNLSAHYALNNSIDASATSGWNSGAGFMPVGDNVTPFTGSLDGHGYTLTGLFINRSITDYVGLFGYISTENSVSNMSLVNMSITGHDNVGGLAGFIQNGAVSNLSAAGNVSGVNQVGGLIGFNIYGAVFSSSAAGNVSGTSSVGGLVGSNYYGSVSDSWATGNVSGDSFVGGLMGYSWTGGTVSNSYATGNVSGAVSEIGGLVGYSQNGYVSGSHATGNVSGISYTGGLIGYNQNTSVSGSYATGNVSITGNCAGGLIGFSHTNSSVSGSYATGNVNGSNTLGGLIGSNEDNSPVSDSYATGTVNGSQAAVGGLIGQNVNGTVYNCSAAGNVSTGDTSGNSMAGGLAGSNNGAVSNCSANGSVSATGDYVGGLIGDNRTGGSVSNSSAAGIVIGRIYVGGLAGFNDGVIINASVTGNVSGNYDIGGLVGYNNGSVNSSHFIGGVLGIQWVGGLIGENTGPVNDSYAAGAVGGTDYVGGLIGSGGSVSCSYSSAHVLCMNEYAGGLAGASGGNISNCYATGSVMNNGFNYTGGLIGYNGGSVNNSYSTGSVGGMNWVGGLIGLNGDTVSNSFWDMETSGWVSSSGGAGVMGKNTSEMKSFATYFNASWDFICEIANGTDDIWGINEDGIGNNGYPFLSWQGFTHKVSFTLIYDTGAGGTINGISPQTVNCSENGSAIEAVPDACYHFVNWSDSSIQNPRTDTNVTNNITVTANLAINTSTLSVTASPGAGGSPYFDGSIPFNCSVDASIHANTSSCYTFTGWTPTDGVANSSAENTTVSMAQNRSLTANFAPIQYNLTISSGGNGSATPSGTTSQNCNDSIPIVATADPCYKFVNWSGPDAGSVSNVNSASTTILMNGAKTIQANFAVAPEDINCDGHVDLFDLVRLGLHWGETGAPEWIPEDVNNDGVIDLFDLVILGINWTG